MLEALLLVASINMYGGSLNCRWRLDILGESCDWAFLLGAESRPSAAVGLAVAYVGSAFLPL